MIGEIAAPNTVLMKTNNFCKKVRKDTKSSNQGFKLLSQVSEMVKRFSKKDKRDTMSSKKE